MTEKDDYAAGDILSRALVTYKEKRYVESADLFKQALAAGDPNGALYLGVIAEYGFIDPPNNEEALKYYTIGADMGLLGCQYSRAVLLGYKGEYDEAMALLKDVADKGYVLAIALLGFVYRNGPRRLQNQELAAEYLKRAADEGQIIAMGGYATFVRKRDGFLKSRLLAVSTLLKILSRFFYRKDSPLVNDEMISDAPKTISLYWRDQSLSAENSLDGG